MALLQTKWRLFDVDDVEALTRHALDETLRSWGATLRPDDYDDALSFLFGIAHECALKYDPSRGLAFSTFCFRRQRLRTVDWYRNRFGDARYGEQPPVDISDEERQTIAQMVDLSFPEVLELVNSVVLSPVGQRTMRRLVKPMLERGWTETEAVRVYAHYTGRKPQEVRRMMDDLREELTCRSLLAA